MEKTQIAIKQYLGFFLEEKEYGIPILKVDGIIKFSKITPIPKVQNYIKGIINLRGQIIPIIDLRLKFGIAEARYNERTCIIVVKIDMKKQEKFVGLIVDIVSEVFSISVSDIESPTDYAIDMKENFLSGIGKIKDKVIMLLDIETIVNCQEVTSLIKNSAEKVRESVGGKYGMD